MFIPLGKIPTKSTSGCKAKLLDPFLVAWLHKCWSQFSFSAFRRTLWFLFRDVLTQKHQRVEVASHTSHWQISGFPQNVILVLFLSPTFCFLGPVQAVLPASKQRGDIWSQMPRPVELVQFPDNYWFALCIWSNIRTFSLLLILQDGYLFSFSNLFSFSLYITGSYKYKTTDFLTIHSSACLLNDAVDSWEDGRHRVGCQNVLCSIPHVLLSDKMFCTAG